MASDAAQHSATDVLVVGGGIAGLATAVGLSRAGASVTVVEQEPDFHEVGAGLELAPNGTRVLAEWGLLDEMTSFGVKPHALVIKDATDGHELTRQDLGAEFERRYGGPYLVAHRSDLLGILLRAAERAGVTLVTGQKIERVETTDDHAVATSASGATFEAQLVVGADGLGSTLRSALSDDEPIASGFVAYRGTCRMSEVDIDADLDNVVAFIGPGCHFVQYPIRKDTEQNGQLLNQVAVFQSPAFLRGESEWGTARGGGCGVLRLHRADQACVAVRPTRSSLAHVRQGPDQPVGRWPAAAHRRRRASDAAISGAGRLPIHRGCPGAAGDGSRRRSPRSREIPKAWDTAAREFNRIRAPHTARVQQTARLWGESWHVDGIARTLRNLLFSGRDPKDYRYTDWLYSDTI